MITIIKQSEYLYNRYPQQTQPQEAFVALDPGESELWANTNAEIGNAVPGSVWHGRVLRFGINCYLLPRVVNELMAEITPLAEIVCDGYEECWDGSNHVGRYTEEAENARAKIEKILDSASADETDSIAVWDAGEWWEGCIHEAREKAACLLFVVGLDSEAATEALEELLDEDECNGQPLILENLDSLAEQLIEEVLEKQERTITIFCRHDGINEWCGTGTALPDCGIECTADLPDEVYTAIDDDLIDGNEAGELKIDEETKTIEYNWIIE